MPATKGAGHPRDRMGVGYFQGCRTVTSESIPLRFPEANPPIPLKFLEIREILVGRIGLVLYLQLTCPPKTGPSVKLDLGWMKGGEMPTKRHTPEQVINKLREAEVAMAQGSTVAEASRQIGVTEQTYYRWRNEYGGLRIDQVKRLKQL